MVTCISLLSPASCLDLDLFFFLPIDSRFSIASFTSPSKRNRADFRFSFVKCKISYKTNKVTRNKFQQSNLQSYASLKASLF